MTIKTATTRDDRAAIDKAISLLVCFGDQASSGIGVSELARRADLSKSTAFRVLGHLERGGVVERVGSAYRLGARLHQLGRDVHAEEHDRIRDILTPHLTDLFVATLETVHLAVLQGTDVFYLSKLYGHRQVRSPSRIGARVPAYCTAVGKAMLAHDPVALDDVLSRSLAPLTPHTAVTADELAQQVWRIRRDGVAYDNDEIRVGLSCVAMPILDPSGRPVAAMSVSGATGRVDTRAHSVVLRRIAADATRAVARASAAPTVRSIA